MTFSFRVPWRFLRRSVSRLTLTVIALACGVALVCAIDIVNRAVLSAFTEVVDTMAGRAALQIAAGEGGVLPEDLAGKIRSVPGVELAAPVVTATAFTADATGESLTVHGVDVTSDDAIRVYSARDARGLQLGDPLEFLNAPDSVVLTREFAERRGLAEESLISLHTPRGQRQFTVRGLLDAQGLARVYGGNLVVMDLYAAEAAFTEPGFVNRIDIVVERAAEVDVVADAIRAILPPGLRIDTPAQRKANLHEVMRSLQAMVSGVGLIALVAAFLIAYNRLATIYEGRVWKLGILAAMGVRSRVVWWELVKESLLIGVAGVLIGIPAGIVLGRLLLPVIATTAALNYKLVAPATELAVQPQSLIIAAALGITAALLAASLPAWRAARHAIVEALRARGVEEPIRGSWALAILRGLVLIAIIAALAAQSISRSADWGLVATGLIAVGVALAAQPLARIMLLAVAPALHQFFGVGGRVAGTLLAANPRRLSLTVATLGVGLGAVLWLAIVAQSFERSVVDVLGRAIRADLVVTSVHIASGFLEAPVSDQLVTDLGGVPGVQAVAGWRALEWPLGGGPVGISAYDPAYFLDRTFGEWPLHGASATNPWEAVARGEAVVVSTSFVQNLQARVGDTLTLDTPTGRLTLPIAGITTDFVSPRGTIEMSRNLFARYWNDHQITRAFVLTTPGASVQAVRLAIAERFGRVYGLRVLSAGELLRYFSEQVRRAFAVIPILGCLVLLVVLVGIADTLAASVIERTRTLGLMSSLGIRRKHVQRMIFIEASTLGALGIALAATAGALLGWLWVTTTFPYLLGWVLELYVPYLQALVAAVGVFVVCLVAAIIPARRAAQLEPAVALRYE